MGAENQRASKDTGEMAETPPGQEKGKGRRRLGDGRTRREGIVKGQGQMQWDGKDGTKGSYRGTGKENSGS